LYICIEVLKIMKRQTRFLNILRKLLLWVLGSRSLRSLSKGSRPDSFRGKVIPAHYLFKSDKYRVLEIDSLIYRLDLSKVVDHSLYFGFADKGFENYMQLLKTEFIVFDVGANIGATALPFSQKVSTVYAFEPSQANFLRLKYHIESNRISNIIPVNKGLGDKTAELHLQVVDPSNPGMNRIRVNGHELQNCEIIDVITIDDFVEQNNIRKVDAIKIDVEGFELKVILGAQQTLQKFHPVLFIELDDENLKEQGNSASELIKFLIEIGYNKITKADTGENITEMTHFRKCHYDIIVL